MYSYALMYSYSLLYHDIKPCVNKGIQNANKFAESLYGDASIPCISL